MDVPAAPADVELLALLTRARASRAQAGDLHPRYVVHLGVFKRCSLVLATLRRLALTRPASAHIATSMPQLVRAVGAQLHWELTDDPFADRDRYQSTLRCHLGELQAAGLLYVQAGENEAGEHVRTEIVLRALPPLDDDELERAHAKLSARYQSYGPHLNTGASTDVVDVADKTRPLTAQEAQQRAIARAKHRARVGLHQDVHPPVGTQKPSALGTAVQPSADAAKSSDACGVRAGAHARDRGRDPQMKRLTRFHSNELTTAGTATNPASGHLSEEEGREVAVDEEVLVVAQRRIADRVELLAQIEQQARQRAREVWSSPAERTWPAGRIREAWAIAALGAEHVAALGHAQAGRLTQEDLARLQRAVARWERYPAGRPAGAPQSGHAALLWLAAQNTAHLARKTIEQLDQASKLARARTQQHDSQRNQRARTTAERRRAPSPGGRSMIAFRRTGAWGSWAALAADGLPLLNDDLRVTVRRGAWAVPPAASTTRRLEARDAHLLRHGWLPVELDGPAQRVLRADAQLEPDPYLAAQADPAPSIRAFMAQTGIARRAAERMTPEQRDALICDLRGRQA